MTDPKAKAASRIDGAEQPPGQWAVRWHGVALFALLTLSVPLWHLTWHGVLGHRHPVVRTRDETPRPPLSSATFFDGTWMSRLERHLQSSSPIVWQLRGFYNEQRYRLGLFSSDEVHCGGDDWFYVGSTLRPDFARFDERENAAARAEFLRRLRQRADELGLLLVVAVVPDKVRIHPEHAYPGGEMPAEKAAAYGRILAEFEAGGALHPGTPCHLGGLSPQWRLRRSEGASPPPPPP